MFCEKCGNKLTEDSKFCDKCGAFAESLIKPKTESSVPTPPDNFIKPEEEYAGFWIRFGAFFIDYVLIAAIFFFLIIFDIDFTETWDNSIAGIFMIIIYHTISLTYKSTTIGKKIFGLRVVDAKTNDKVNFWKALGRSLSYIISSFIFCLGFISAAFNKKKQAWHDQIAGTVVMKNKNTNITLGVILSIVAVIISFILIYEAYSPIDEVQNPSTYDYNQTETSDVDPVAEADYQEGYKAGYADGRSSHGELGDNYTEPATEERRDAYLLGYLDGFLKGCREGNFDCSEVEDLVNSLGKDSETNVNLIPSDIN